MIKHKLIRITTVPISLYSLLKGQLQFMNQYYDVMGVSSEGDLLELVGEREGIQIRAIDMTRTISPFKDLKAVWSLYRLFKKERPFIVHTHTPKAGTLGMLAAWLAGVPYRLHTVAGLPLLEASGNKRRLLDLVEKATYACATKIYPNSIGLFEIILKSKYTSKKKLKVIGLGSSNGIDTKYFNPVHFSPTDQLILKTQLGIKPSDFVFIFVGRIVGDKGINELIAAYHELNSKNKQVKLLLVGSLEIDLDPLHQDTIAIIASNPNVISIGYQLDVRPYFAISDVLVFPSYREGFPNVVMQAGAMGLPAIVTNINGCNEIIIEHKNGAIIPVKDIQTLLNAMIKFATDRIYFDSLKRNAREMITARYEQQEIWNAIFEEYKNLDKNV